MHPQAAHAPDSELSQQALQLLTGFTLAFNNVLSQQVVDIDFDQEVVSLSANISPIGLLCSVLVAAVKIVTGVTLADRTPVPEVERPPPVVALSRWRDSALGLVPAQVDERRIKTAASTPRRMDRHIDNIA